MDPKPYGRNNQRQIDPVKLGHAMAVADIGYSDIVEALGRYGKLEFSSIAHTKMLRGLCPAPKAWTAICNLLGVPLNAFDLPAGAAVGSHPNKCQGPTPEDRETTRSESAATPGEAPPVESTVVVTLSWPAGLHNPPRIAVESKSAPAPTLLGKIFEGNPILTPGLLHRAALAQPRAVVRAPLAGMPPVAPAAPRGKTAPRTRQGTKSATAKKPGDSRSSATPAQSSAAKQAAKPTA